MPDDTPVAIHWTLPDVIARLRAQGRAVLVVDGPLGEPLEPDPMDDGRDHYVGDLLDAGVAGELSWIVAEQLIHGAYRNG